MPWYDRWMPWVTVVLSIVTILLLTGMGIQSMKQSRWEEAPNIVTQKVLLPNKEVATVKLYYPQIVSGTPDSIGVAVGGKQERVYR